MKYVMATDSIKNSSDEEISFSEWQFVVKNKGECSDDDESIEIIEREILQSVTPSSCSEDENENENEKEDEVEMMDWEVSIEDESYNFNDEESKVNSLSEVDSDQPANNCFYASEDNHVATINNHFSRKVLYSCVLAAVIGVVIHQYRGNLLDMLNRVYTKSEVSEPSSQEPALHIQAELKQQSTDFKIQSDDAFVQNLVKKREQFKKLWEKYELILSKTFIPRSNIYAVDFSNLLKVLYGEDNSLDSVESTPCNTDIDNIQPPLFCTDSSGKILLFLEEIEYNELMRKVLNAMQFDEDKMLESLNNLIKVYSKSEHLKSDTLESANSEVFEYSKDELSSSEINLKNIQTNELFDDSLIKGDTIATNTVEIDGPETRENPVGVETQIQEIIDEIRTLGRKIKTQVDDFHRLWTSCNKNERNSCVSKNELPEQNDTSTTESEKLNATHPHTEETNPASVSDFIYKSVPITDRWSAKEEFKPRKYSEFSEKTNGEWLLKLGKAREKYRNKRFKEKGSKKKTHKSNDKEKPVHEMYKRYREFITRTREKMKTDYKVFASQFKSKLKKFGDGMKRSYEKFISSDWKHYARSVFFPFRF